MLPSELWLRVFEIAAGWDSDCVDIEALRENKRNACLLSFAIVCRQWTPLALQVLYREVFLPGWDFHDDDSNYCAQTTLSLKRLIHTLTRLTGRRSNLPGTVQVLHVAVGRYQYPSSIYDYCLHCDFASVAQAVQLCPRVQHLSLRVHCEPTGHTWSIPQDVLRTFSKARHIEQITYSDQQDVQVMDKLRTIAALRAAAGGDFATYTVNPSLRPLFQLLSVLPCVRYLQLETGDADGSDVLQPATVSLPQLRELRVRVKGLRQFPSSASLHALCDAAPNLGTVTLADGGPSQIHALPLHIDTLLLRGPELAIDLREFRNLSHVGIEFPIYMEHHRSPALETLSRLPESVTHLTLFGEHDENGVSNPYSPAVDVAMQELLQSSAFLGHLQKLYHLQKLSLVVDPGLPLRMASELLQIFTKRRLAFEIVHSVRDFERAGP